MGKLAISPYLDTLEIDCLLGGEVGRIADFGALDLDASLGILKFELDLRN